MTRTTGGKKMAAVSVWLQQQDRERLERVAKYLGVSRAQFIRAELLRVLSEYEAAPKED